MKDKELFQAIDLLAHEYGWTIEYIQNLTPLEISQLIDTIINRKNAELLLLQTSIARGVHAGMTGDTSVIKPLLTDENQEPQQRYLSEKDKEWLAKVFGAKEDIVREIKNGKRNEI
ncbi:MAG: hypothetical protein ACTSYR_02165 [Candidatus Odinarchaeia archaeon]